MKMITIENRELVAGACILASVFLGAAYLASTPTNQLRQQNIEKAKSVIEPDNRKMLEVKVTRLDFGHGCYGGNGLGIRFYDLDGDGKTVEQYVRFIDANTPFPYGVEPYGVETDLIRLGQEPEFDPQNLKKVRREMTKTEADILDKEYQTLFGKF
ncbi:MAG: hypothetical protein AABX29_04835 [Nanoarchaeota archaeon]